MTLSWGVISSRQGWGTESKSFLLPLSLSPSFLGLALRVTFSGEQGLLVYANRGSEEDFMELYHQGIKLQDSIVLTRYGGVGRRAKVSSSPQCKGLGGEGGWQWAGGCAGEGDGAGLRGRPALGSGQERVKDSFHPPMACFGTLPSQALAH